MAEGLERSEGLGGGEGLSGSSGLERSEGLETAGGARGAAERAREAASVRGRDLLDRAVERKDELKQRAAGAADARKSELTGRAESISRALQGAADSLRESGEPQLSSWVSQAAGQVDRIVGYMQGKPADGMLHDFEDLARRNPALFLGGTYLAGMAVGRFLRASTPQPTSAPESAYAPELGSPLSRDPLEPGSAFGDRPAAESGVAQPWTGVGVGPSVGGTSADGFDTSVDGGTGYRAGGAGDGESGLTDEEVRDAWHERDARRGTDSGYDASSVRGDDAIDTGELTSYTNGDAAAREDDGFDDDLDPRRGV